MERGAGLAIVRRAATIVGGSRTALMGFWLEQAEAEMRASA